MKEHNSKKMPKSVIVLFLLAVILLLGSSIGGARAALIIFSEDYTSHMEIYHIGVTLNENGKTVCSRDYAGDNSWTEKSDPLLQSLIPEGESLKLGYAYPEKLTVTNSGDINEYVRLIIRKYWLDEKDQKVTGLFPEQIDLHFTEDGWVKDDGLSTKETTILYYNSMLPPGSTSSAATDTLIIDPSIARIIGTEQEGNVVKTVYEYDHMRFVIEAEVDAVQDHNAEDAIASAWGADVSISGNSLSVN